MDGKEPDTEGRDDVSKSLSCIASLNLSQWHNRKIRERTRLFSFSSSSKSCGGGRAAQQVQASIIFFFPVPVEPFFASSK